MLKTSQTRQAPPAGDRLETSEYTGYALGDAAIFIRKRCGWRIETRFSEIQGGRNMEV
jgi:hypothetical protein